MRCVRMSSEHCVRAGPERRPGKHRSLARLEWHLLINVPALIATWFTSPGLMIRPFWITPPGTVVTMLCPGRPHRQVEPSQSIPVPNTN